METKFNVFSIFNTKGDYSRVTIDSQVFQAIARSNPKQPYTTSFDAQKRPIRVFNIDGVKIFAREVPLLNEDKTPKMQEGTDGKEYTMSEWYLYMKTSDAAPLQTNKEDETKEFSIDCD